MNISYQILQLKHNDENHGYLFSSLNFLEKFGLKLSLNRYHVVYCHNEDVENFNLYEFLEELFTKFNIHHPEDFRGHSLSVSDIVYINNEYWYCDSLGWEKIAFDN